MSIFQGFEKAKDAIGPEKYNMIEKYLKTICNQNTVDKYFNELNTIWKLPPDTWNKKSEELKQKYGVILLDDVLHKPNEWIKYENWYNDKYLHRNIKVLKTWHSDYDDIRCNVMLYQDKKEIANIIASYDELDLRYSIGNQDSEMNDEFINIALTNLIYSDFDSYLELPKISKCSRLLQKIYNNVCESDSTMCHIDWMYWKENYNFKDEDIIKLQSEITKYGLEEVITINEGEYKIIGYGDLETKFNDDRNLEISKNSEIGL